MYATLENLANGFEARLLIIIRNQCKEAPLIDIFNTDKLRTAFEDRHVGCKIYAEDHLPKPAADMKLNEKTFQQRKSMLL